MKNDPKGISLGLFSASLFGLIPLFAVSLEKEYGMGQPSILFYRFLFATVSLLPFYWKNQKKQENRGNKKLGKKQIKIRLAILFALGFFYAATSLGLLWSYYYIPVGTAITIHFLYPALTVIISIVFLQKKVAELKYLLIAAFLSFTGVFLLCWTGQEVLNLPGILWAFMTVVTYALYMVGLGLDKWGTGEFSLKGMDPSVRTFYIMFFCTILFGIYALLTGGIEPIDSQDKWINLVVMAVLSTALADYWLILAEKKTDTTIASILGVMEPVVGVCVSVCFFSEVLTGYGIIGLVLALSSIIIVIWASKEPENKKPENKAAAT